MWYTRKTKETERKKNNTLKTKLSYINFYENIFFIVVVIFIGTDRRNIHTKVVAHTLTNGDPISSWLVTVLLFLLCSRTHSR